MVAVALVLSSLAVAQVTVVRAGRLIDPDSGTVLSNQVILIKDGRIQAVGRELALPANATVIDLSDKTVFPGLIDCHTHVADGQSDGEPFNVLRKTASQIALESVPNARAMLLSGFTTVRDVGTYRALNDIALRDAIARGDVIGPRMFVAGAYITITGGAGAMTGQAPDIQLPWDLHYGRAWMKRVTSGCGWRCMRMRRRESATRFWRARRRLSMRKCWTTKSSRWQSSAERIWIWIFMTKNVSRQERRRDRRQRISCSTMPIWGESSARISGRRYGPA